MSNVLSSTVRSTTTEAIVDQQGTIATNNVSNAAAGPVSNAPAPLRPIICLVSISPSSRAVIHVLRMQ
jgi:hypothetical protein